ncbi:MAG: zinc transporter ZupT [Candidatus Woesearchaeota archaeon]
MEINSIWVPLLLSLIAGLFTSLGSLFAIFIKKFNRKFLTFGLGLSAGVMIYVSLVELLPDALEVIGFLPSNLAFFAGIGFILILDFIIPHDHILKNVNLSKKHSKLLRAGTVAAIGIAIHNFPEGFAVILSSLSDIKLSISLAIAVAIHNIPEGFSIAMPIYYATGSRKRAFWYSFIAGIAEPVGALLGVLFLFAFLTPALLAYSLAFVAGIMVVISFDELLPLCFCEGKDRSSLVGVVAGMFVMALSLYLF